MSFKIPCNKSLMGPSKTSARKPLIRSATNPTTVPKIQSRGPNPWIWTSILPISLMSKVCKKVEVNNFQKFSLVYHLIKEFQQKKIYMPAVMLDIELDWI